MKEKYLWIAGSTIFIGGFAIGSMSFGSKFWEVESIHDLFEMFSSAATVGAVFVAWKGVNAWRLQARGQADLELARRVSRIALAAKEKALPAWVDAAFTIREIPFGASKISESLLEQMRQAMSMRVETYDIALADLRVVLQEAKAVWDDGFTRKYNAFIDLLMTCSACSKQFLIWADRSTDPAARLRAEQYIHNFRRDLSDQGMLDFECDIRELIIQKTRDADLELERHMLRK
ncbi:hypothetical protein CHR29_16815 [Pseudomonas monteilii]|uniref:hypothetical protein n=1 Tax=Pseudomonas monteilii TaxID=76759 RepID=UPI0003799BAD|nr:hypothetical protein [Pseudomonas monteilii]AYN16717.1 hypothetical protein CHR29_16815 [Pseudomonas monteilii]